MSPRTGVAAPGGKVSGAESLQKHPHSSLLFPSILVLDVHNLHAKKSVQSHQPRVLSNWLIVASGDVTAQPKCGEEWKPLWEAEVWPGRCQLPSDPREDKEIQVVGKKGQGNEGRSAQHQGQHGEHSARLVLTSSAVSQRDNDQGSTSGQASVPVCPREMGEARESMGFAAGRSSWVWVQL